MRALAPPRLFGTLVVGSIGTAMAVSLVAVSVMWGAPVNADTPQSTSANLADAAESWYRANPPSCGSPVGCPPGPTPGTTSYPANTLHVGVFLGAESARTYAEPDFSQLPDGSVLTSGTMALPISTDPNAGNSNVAAAAIVACLVTKPITDGVEGSTGQPPPVDCRTSARAVYRPSGSFTVDLGPFIAAWSNGALRLGVALLPAAGQAPSASWHVAFNGRKLAGAPHVSSAVMLNASGAAPGGSTIPPADAGASPGSRPTTPALGPANSGASGPPSGTAPPPGGPGAPTGDLAAPTPTLPGRAGGASSSGPQLTEPAPAAPLAQSAAPSLPASAPSVASDGASADAVQDTGYRYSEIMLLPLVMLLGVAFLIRTFTGDVTPQAWRQP